MNVGTNALRVYLRYSSYILQLLQQSDITRRFNDLYCKGNRYKKRCKAAGIPSRPAFVEPEAMIVKEGARVMSLTDGTSKMSKSDPNDLSRINQCLGST